MIDTNLRPAFFLSQAAARHMVTRGGGQIINIASMLTFQGGIRVSGPDLYDNSAHARVLVNQVHFGTRL